MNSFLVREALGYSEFVEALVRLHEDKVGIKQHEKDFDLPDDDYESYDDWWDDWYQQDWYESAPTTDGLPTETAPRETTAAEPTQVEGSGGTPVNRRGVSTPSRRSVGVPSTDIPPGFEPFNVNEMTLGDSFVLGVLRGFRLLQAAGLTADEKRDIISTTKGSLEFEVITQALQTLWDEQLLGQRLVVFKLITSKNPHIMRNMMVMNGMRTITLSMTTNGSMMIIGSMINTMLHNLLVWTPMMVMWPRLRNLTLPLRRHMLLRK